MSPIFRLLHYLLPSPLGEGSGVRLLFPLGEGSGVRLLFLLLSPSFAHAQQPHSYALDDVLQYTPYATVFALKACGVDSHDDWKTLTLTTAASFVASAGIGYLMKQTIDEWRPDHSDRKSMPSGHAVVAFGGATMLRHEYGHLSPWITVAGYGVATLTAVDRVVRDRHHWYDVVAGAGIGIAATEVTWWLSRKLFPKQKDRLLVGINERGLELAMRF